MNRQQHISRSGVILPMALGLILLMSALVVLLMEEWRGVFAERAVQYSQAHHRSEAYSGLNIAMATLAEIHKLDNGWYGPAQGWDDPLRYAGLQDQLEGLTVSVWDETGKISLHRENTALLEALMEQLGYDHREQAVMLDSLLDWTDGDDITRLNGAEADYYSALNPPYRPANRPLTTLNELNWIRGWREGAQSDHAEDRARYAQLIDQLTVAHRQEPNINTASPTVINALAQHRGFESPVNQLNADSAEAFIGERGLYRNSGGFSGFPAGLNTRASVLRVESRVERSEGGYLVTAWISDQTDDSNARMAQQEENGPQNYPFQILAIQENQIIR